MRSSSPSHLITTGATDAVLQISTNQVGPSERVDFWRELVCRRFAEVEIASRLGGDFSGAMVCRPWANLRLTRVQAKAQSVQRRLRQPQSENEDCYFAVLLLAGTEWLEQDGREVLLQPGDLTIYDATRPHRLVFSQDFQKLILQLPRKSLKDRIAGIERCTALRIPGSDGVGGVTAGFLRAFAANAKQLERDQLAKLAEQALDLLAMAVGSVRPIDACYSHSRSLSLCRVKSFVDQHIADPTLDTATVANLVGLSSRYINKLLEDEDTSLLRYVWKRRLEYCRNDLADPTHAWHRVSEIALRWGFNDLSHFSRAFRKQFGMSPREFRQTKHDVKRLPDSFRARLKARKSRHASGP